MSRRPPRWARQLRRVLGMEMAIELDKQLQNGWERLIVQALPASREREKVRYQFLMASVEMGTGAVDIKKGPCYPGGIGPQRVVDFGPAKDCSKDPDKHDV